MRRQVLGARLGQKEGVLETDADVQVLLHDRADLLLERPVLRRIRQAIEGAVADVDAGLDREGHARFERTRVVADVVDVQPDPVADAVRVPDTELVARGVGDKTQLHEPGSDDLFDGHFDLTGVMADDRGLDARVLGCPGRFGRCLSAHP